MIAKLEAEVDQLKAKVGSLDEELLAAKKLKGYNCSLKMRAALFRVICW